MQNIETLKMLIERNGIDTIIRILCSDDLPENLKVELNKSGIFRDNLLCLSLVYTLV